jgi:Flp pilus assembly protein TadD
MTFAPVAKTTLTFGLIMVVAAGCAGLKPKKTASATEPLSTETADVAKRRVQNIRMEPSGVDGHTSWIIEPEVPRIPKIEGVALQLPPHIERRLGRAFDLAQRGATYSAHTEFHGVLALCALELDARDGVTVHRESLREGLIALHEADELCGQPIDWSNSSDAYHASAGKARPIVEGSTPARADSIQVVQKYFTFAEDRFVYACQGMPGASLAYYGLARTYVQPGTRHTHAAGKAAMMQRVALRIEPMNVLAANELGVLLAQHGRLNEAEALFKECVATNATPESLQNLAVVYARQGRSEASRAAKLESDRLAEQRARATSGASGLSVDAVGSEHAIAQAAQVDESPIEENLSEADSERKGFLRRIELSQMLPGVFRR